jgi:arginine exporter protein ArgO
MTIKDAGGVMMGDRDRGVFQNTKQMTVRTMRMAARHTATVAVIAVGLLNPPAVCDAKESLGKFMVAM